MKLLILVGGESAEREVSLSSGRAVATALRSAGHEVLAIDAGNSREELEMFTAGELQAKAIISSEAKASGEIAGELADFDCVFIALHGGSGENGTLQALLDLAGVCYTGSGVQASALAMDKYRARLVFKALGIPTPKQYFFGQIAEALAVSEQWPLPLVVKPNAQGSTVGLSIVREASELLAALELAAKYDTNLLIEEYIPGRELTVAVLGDQALPVVEIVPKSGFYDYRAKYAAGETEYICPAELPDLVARAAQQHALTAFHGIGCQGYARVDFRLDDDHNLYCLEVNTLPGMTDTSLVPKAAAATGIGFAGLLERIIKLAMAEEHGR